MSVDQRVCHADRVLEVGNTHPAKVVPCVVLKNNATKFPPEATSLREGSVYTPGVCLVWRQTIISALLTYLKSDPKEQTCNKTCKKMNLKKFIWKLTGIFFPASKCWCFRASFPTDCHSFVNLCIKDLYFLNEGCTNKLCGGHKNFEFSKNKDWQTRFILKYTKKTTCDDLCMYY